MLHAQSSLLDYPPLPLPHGAPSLLFPSHGDIHCDPRPGRQFGRFAEQSPLTGCEPNDLVEVSSTALRRGSYHQEERPWKCQQPQTFLMTQIRNVL